MKLTLTFMIFASLLLLVPIHAEAKTYENELYTFEFPNGCKLEKKENRFSTIDANLECREDTGFQFESGGLIESFAGYSETELIDTVLSSEESKWDSVVEVERGTEKYSINNQTAPYIIATYDQKFSNAFGLETTKPWVSMSMIIRVGDDMVLAQYRNNEDDFDKQLPTAEKIFQSVKPVAVQPENSTESLAN